MKLTNMNSIRVRDKMSSPVETISGDKTIEEAAKLMKKKNIGSLLVINEDDTQSMLTERDVVRAVAEGNIQVPTSKFSTKPLISVDEEAFLGDAAQLMLSKKIRRLAVSNESGKVSGIINIRDVTSAVHDAFLAIFDA